MGVTGGMAWLPRSSTAEGLTTLVFARAFGTPGGGGGRGGTSETEVGPAGTSGAGVGPVGTSETGVGCCCGITCGVGGGEDGWTGVTGGDDLVWGGSMGRMHMAASDKVTIDR